MNSAITMKKIILMMMAVLTALSAAATDILEHSLFTDPDGQEIALSNESSQVQPALYDLSGEIVFENGGNLTTALDGGGNIIEMYTSISATQVTKKLITRFMLMGVICLMMRASTTP